MPPILINYIFKETFSQNQLQTLWHWIKEYSIDRLSFPYQYLSLLLFLENHHSKLLQKPRLFNTDMQNQMGVWFPKAKVKCSSDAIGTYRNSFFNYRSFSYESWVNGDGIPPTNYDNKPDQSEDGFIYLHKLTNYLETYLPELNI